MKRSVLPDIIVSMYIFPGTSMNWTKVSGVFRTADVDRFLTIAGQEGLYVAARPGPYICSEWDGVLYGIFVY